MRSGSVIAVTLPKRRRRMVFPQAVSSSSVMTNKMILQNLCDLEIITMAATKPIGKMCEWNEWKLLTVTSIHLKIS